MGWISPRKADEVARKASESAARDLERQLGRSLTGKELKTVHEKVTKGIRDAADQTRKDA